MLNAHRDTYNIIMVTRQKLFLRLLLALSALTLGVIFYVDVYDDVAGDLTRRGLLIDEGIMPEESGLPDGTYDYPDGSVGHVVREENEDHFIAKEVRTRKLDHVEDHFIVKLNLSPGVDPHETCFALAESIGGEVEYVFIGLFTGCDIVPSEITGMSDTDMEASLNTVVGVGAIMKDGPIEAYSIGTGSDPIWNLDRIDQCSLPLDGISFKEDASNVKVFIMDSGIRADHEEFVGMINPNDACHFSYPFAFKNGHTYNPPPLEDGNGHGTHVAGTVCGHKYGVSSNCQICSVKILKGITKTGSYSASIAGLNHIETYCAANPGTRCVVNMSLGGQKHPFFNEQIEDAIAAGIVVVAAAGNDNDDACNYSPASATSAIAVGATTKNDARWMSCEHCDPAWVPSSNFGSCVDVWAPGAEIVSASSANVNEHSTKDGTSMACPREYMLLRDFLFRLFVLHNLTYSLRPLNRCHWYCCSHTFEEPHIYSSRCCKCDN
jgi:hypothetical protein